MGIDLRNTDCHVFWNSDAMLKTKSEKHPSHPTVDLARQMAMAGWKSAGDRSSKRSISGILVSRLRQLGASNGTERDDQDV